MDLVWRIETTVKRDSPAGVPALAQIPLLPGEAVTTASAVIKDGKVQVNLGPNADLVSWSSTLSPSSVLSLTAGIPSDPSQTPWAETWAIDASTLWHVEPVGLAPAAAESGRAGDAALFFYPWPGETLQLKLDRPQPVAGQTLTLDRSQLQVNPGARATDYVLMLQLRSSRGLDHNITLPEGATLQGVQINGQPRSLRLQGRTLTVPIVPGKQTVSISWRLEEEISAAFQTTPASLNVDSVNHNLVVTLPSNRWLLWASGPGLGPAILFWGVLLVLMLVGVALARWSGRFGLPLGLSQWLLLMLGMTQVAPWGCAAVVGWFFLMAWRDRDAAGSAGLSTTPWWRFDLVQVGLVFATIVMLGVLFNVVAGSLLGQPDMQVIGNGSSAYRLQWTQDRLASELPTATIISVPLMVYRGLMLMWALWLAWSLLNWLRWGWGAWSQGGVWRSREPKAQADPADVSQGAAG
jgi:hypothetical protein